MSTFARVITLQEDDAVLPGLDLSHVVRAYTQYGGGLGEWDDSLFPAVHASEPAQSETVPFRALDHRDRTTVEYALEQRKHGGSYNTLMVGAGIEFATGERGRWTFAANRDSAQRGKDCAEQRALAMGQMSGHLRGDSRLISVATAWKRVNGSEKPNEAVGLCPCPSCRRFLSQYASPDTRVLMAIGDGETSQVVPFHSILPLHFQGRTLEKAVESGREDLGELRLTAVTDLPFLFAKALEMAEKALSRAQNVRGRGAFGAALIEAPIREGQPNITIVSGSSQVLGKGEKTFDAITMAEEVGKAQGLKLYQGAVVLQDLQAVKRAIASPPPHSRQILLELSQTVGAPIPVVLNTLDDRTVAVVPAPHLLPLGEGPLESSSANRFMHLFRIGDR